MRKLQAILVAVFLFVGMSSFTVEDLDPTDNCHEHAVEAANASGSTGVAFAGAYIFYQFWCEAEGGCPCDTLEPVIING